MDELYKIIIEDGYHLLVDPKGQVVPGILHTTVKQGVDKVTIATIEILVNLKETEYATKSNH